MELTERQFQLYKLMQAERLQAKADSKSKILSAWMRDRAGVLSAFLADVSEGFLESFDLKPCENSDCSDFVDRHCGDDFCFKCQKEINSRTMTDYGFARFEDKDFDLI